MKSVIIIPARMESTRFQGKPLADCGGVPLLRRVVDAARQTQAVDVVVASPDREVCNYCRDNGIRRPKPKARLLRQMNEFLTKKGQLPKETHGIQRADRYRARDFPPLAVVRARFLAEIGPIAWDEPELDTWEKDPRKWPEVE